MIHNLDKFLGANSPAGLIPAYEPDAEIAIPNRYRITDDGAASWAMRKLRTLRAKEAEFVALGEREVNAIETWLHEVTAPLQQDALFFEGLLVEYAQECRENPDDGRKTVKLPAGSVTSRQGSTKWEVDAERFLPWARTNHPDLIRVKEDPNLPAIKDALAGAIDATAGKVITADGEIVPGVEVHETGITYRVVPKLEGEV